MKTVLSVQTYMFMCIESNKTNEYMYASHFATLWATLKILVVSWAREKSWTVRLPSWAWIRLKVQQSRTWLPGYTLTMPSPVAFTHFPIPHIPHDQTWLIISNLWIFRLSKHVPQPHVHCISLHLASIVGRALYSDAIDPGLISGRIIPKTLKQGVVISSLGVPHWMGKCNDWLARSQYKGLGRTTYLPSVSRLIIWLKNC